MIRDQLALVHANPVSIENGTLRVDRKFHLGMLSFVQQMKLHCCTLHPRLHPGQRIMDQIEVAVQELPYSIQSVAVDARGALADGGVAMVREVIGRSRLTYGTGMMSFQIARELKRPYVSILEYDLKTQLTVTTSEVSNPVRRAVRAAKCIWNYRKYVLPEIAGSDAVHCNGFPIYDVARQYNQNALLYLDSRMSEQMVIPDDELESRIRTLGGRRIRLLYSGRYEALKGALDAVKVGVECIRLGLDIEMHCYGQGNLRDRMREIARTSTAPDRIFIHDAIPYPELVKVSRTFDLFVCCHVQNDPSCTYLESMGAGLPIVGYANRMWERLQATSRVGYCSELGKPGPVALDVKRLAENPGDLAEMSRRAAAFARKHCFEAEFKKRIDSINSMV